MELRGISLNGVHTGNDWGLTMSVCKVDPPAVKTYYVAIEGRDGDLDFTEALTGEIHYENRNGTFEFILTDGTHAERETLINTIYAAVHGRQIRLILPDYPDYYMIGRFSVTDDTNTAAYGTISLSAVLEPWKYKATETVVEENVTNIETTMELVNNGRRTLLPVFKIEGDVVIKHGTASFSLSAGEYTIPELTLKTGTTTLRVSSTSLTGKITATYREAIL